MDDTDTSHLQGPDATLPASSLANDLKILLTYSKRAERGWLASHHVQKRVQFKGKQWGVAETCQNILKIYFCISDGVCFQQRGRDFIMLQKNCED